MGGQHLASLECKRNAAVFSERNRALKPLLIAVRGFGVGIICHFSCLGTVCEHSEGHHLPCSGVSRVCEGNCLRTVPVLPCESGGWEVLDEQWPISR